MPVGESKQWVIPENLIQYIKRDGCAETSAPFRLMRNENAKVESATSTNHILRTYWYVRYVTRQLDETAFSFIIMSCVMVNITTSSRVVLPFYFARK